MRTEVQALVTAAEEALLVVTTSLKVIEDAGVASELEDEIVAAGIKEGFAGRLITAVKDVAKSERREEIARGILKALLRGPYARDTTFNTNELPKTAIEMADKLIDRLDNTAALELVEKWPEGKVAEK